MEGGEHRDLFGYVCGGWHGFFDSFRPASCKKGLEQPDAVGIFPSFFSLLQKNVLNRRTWTTRDEPRIAVVTWLERTYHRRRRQAGLGRLSPIEYEAILTTPVTQAA